MAAGHRQNVVVYSVPPRQDRTEAFCREIAIVDLVPLRAQDPDDLRMQARDETRLNRMGEQHQDAQRRSALRRAGSRLEAGEEEVLARGKIKLRVLPGDHLARIE